MIKISLYPKVWFSFRVLANLAGKTHKSASNLVQIEQISSHPQNIPKLHFWSYRGMRNLCRFLGFVESPTKISGKSSNCKINLTAPPLSAICSIFNALYVVHPMLHMWPTQCFICSISSASYIVYSVLHMRPIQCFICSIFSAPYAAYSVLHM